MNPKMETEQTGEKQTTGMPVGTLLAGQSYVDPQDNSDPLTEPLMETSANDTIMGDISTGTVIDMSTQTIQSVSTSASPIVDANDVALKKKLKKNLKAKLRRERQKANRLAAAGSSKKVDIEAPEFGSTPKTGTTNTHQNRAAQQITSSSTATSSKRKRGTPLNDSKLAKRRDQKSTPQLNSGASYSSVVVESHLIMAVMHMDENNQGIVPATKELYTEVFYALNDLMFEDMDANSVLPSFHNTRIKQRVIRIACKSAESRLWLLGIAERLGEKVGKSLKICDFDTVPHQRKFFAFFPYVKQDNDRILRMLNACNPQLQEIKWEVIRRKEISSGINLLITVEEETADKLTKNDGSLGFGAGNANFREIIPRSKKAPAGKSVEIRLDNETTDAEGENLDKLANLSLVETTKQHTETTNVESAETAEEFKPASASRDTFQGKVQFTVRGIGKKSTSTGKSPKKKKTAKHNDGAKSKVDSEKEKTHDSDVNIA